MTFARRIGVTAALAAALSAGSTASAQVGDRGRRFGLGLALGYPHVGLGMNYFVGPQSLQIDVAFRYRYADDNSGGIFVRGDYLFYPLTLARGGAADLKLYVGPGINLGLGLGRKGFGFGVELPVGLTVQLRRVPIDVAIEAVPVLQIINGGNIGPDYFGIGGSLHVRYYF